MWKNVSSLLICRHLDVRSTWSRQTTAGISIQAAVHVRSVGDWSDAPTIRSEMVISCCGMSLTSLTSTKVEVDSTIMILHPILLCAFVCFGLDCPDSSDTARMLVSEGQCVPFEYLQRCQLLSPKASNALFHQLFSPRHKRSLRWYFL